MRSRCVFVCLAALIGAVAAADPAITYTLDPPNPKSGIPFRVAYEVSWQGSAVDFAILPSEPAPVAWGSARLVDAASTSAPPDVVGAARGPTGPAAVSAAAWSWAPASAAAATSPDPWSIVAIRP